MRANTHTHHSSFARNAGEFSPLIILHSPATRANSHTHHSSFARNAGEYSPSPFMERGEVRYTRQKHMLLDEKLSAI